MDLRSERGSATRLHVIETATRLFAADGFDGVSVESVLRACGLSKGALYHHFRNKDALFAAVHESVEAAIVASVVRATQGQANPLDALRMGCNAWLDLVASDPAVRRIAVVDAPSVLGWQAWRQVQARHVLGLLRAALTIAAEAGCFPPARVETYASILLAVLNELAMLIARSDDRAEASKLARDGVEQVISRLVGVDPGAPWPRHPGS